MNLRQIIRNQKLINFDYKLIDFISEADQDKIKTGKKTGTDPHYWYKNTKTGDTISSTDKNAQRQNYVLATKKDVADTQDRDEERLQQQMAKEPMPPGKETDDEDRDEERPDRQRAKEPMPPKKQPKAKSKKKKEYDWRAEEHKPEGEDGRPSPAQINGLRTQMFGDGEGRSSDYAGQGDQSTPAGNPPSDAKARTTALDLGFPTPKGATRGPSKITGEMAAPAPGNPGSMMNEVFSVEGCNVAEAFYERFGVAPTVEEMESILQEQFGNSQLAEDNGGPNDSDYRKKLRIAAEASITKFDRLKNAEAANANTEPPFGKMIKPPSEFYGAKDSIEAQAKMIRDLPDDAIIFGPDGPITEITDSPRTRAELEEAIAAAVKKGHFADADPSFNIGTASTPKIDEAAVKDAVEKMIKNNDVKKFAELLALAGGGGANPSDTATFAQSEDGNLMILFHSDKMSTNDQQANSTLAQEARRQEVYLRELIDSKPPQLSDDDAPVAAAILEEFSEILKETSEENDSGIVAQTALKLTGDGQQEAIIAALEANPNRPPTIGSRPAQKSFCRKIFRTF